MEVENSGKVGGTVREKWKEWALLILAGILLAVVCLTAVSYTHLGGCTA